MQSPQGKLFDCKMRKLCGVPHAFPDKEYGYCGIWFLSNTKCEIIFCFEKVAYLKGFLAVVFLFCGENFWCFFIVPVVFLVFKTGRCAMFRSP